MCPRQLAQVHCILLRVSWSPRVPPRPPPTPTCCWHSAPTSPVSIIGINCIDSPTSSAGATTRLPLGENNGKVVSTTSSLPAINRHWRHNLKLFLTFRVFYEAWKNCDAITIWKYQSHPKLKKQSIYMECFIVFVPMLCRQLNCCLCQPF